MPMSMWLLRLGGLITTSHFIDTFEINNSQYCIY
jgi:hypothetical protein